MKPVEVAVCLTLALGLVSCASPEPSAPPAGGSATQASSPTEVDDATMPGEPGPESPDAVARYAAVIAEQDRVNRYFHRQILPRLNDCWAEVGGEGSVAVRTEFRRDAGRWVAGESHLRGSSLAKDGGEQALRCMAEATRATSFAEEAVDGDATEFVVNWTLPVPWPTDLRPVAMRMAVDTGGGGGGGGGCGPETPPACQDCWFVFFFKFSLCVPTCAGYVDCVVEEDLNGCRMKTKCVTVSPWGNVGGFVMY